jgi:hypothetical protein
MSLTETANVFASIHETALNDVIRAFCTDRPRYLVYGSPSFVPATTVAETSMAAIAFPGVPGGIQWRVRLSVPRVDLFKPSATLPPELTPMPPGSFSVRLGVELCLDCRRIRIDPKPPRGKPGEKGHDGRKPNEPGRAVHPLQELTCCRLEVLALGHLEHVMTTTGEDAIALAVDRIEIVDVAPGELESVMECLLFMILQAVLAEIRLPLRALRAGAFSLSVTQGPLIEDDQVKARGSF